MRESALITLLISGACATPPATETDNTGKADTTATEFVPGQGPVKLDPGTIYKCIDSYTANTIYTKLLENRGLEAKVFDARGKLLRHYGGRTPQTLRRQASVEGRDAIAFRYYWDGNDFEQIYFRRGNIHEAEYTWVLNRGKLPCAIVDSIPDETSRAPELWSPADGDILRCQFNGVFEDTTVIDAAAGKLSVLRTGLRGENLGPATDATLTHAEGNMTITRATPVGDVVLELPASDLNATIVTDRMHTRDAISCWLER